MANLNVLELVATTLRNRRRDIADATSRNSAIIYKLREKKRIKTLAGGRVISEPIMYGENQNFMWYRGREALSIAGQEVITAAEYAWKQYACGVSISGDEMMMNSGDGQIIDMMEQRIENAELTIVNSKAAAMYSDGTAFGGKSFGGLDLLNGSGAGATVGGIPSSLHSYWNNYIQSGGGAPTAATVYPAMLALYLRLQVGMQYSDLIMSDNSYYIALSSHLQAQQRFMDAKMANAGFRHLMFEGTPVCPDGGQDGFAPVGMHFLTTKAICLSMMRGRNNQVLQGAADRPINEDSNTVIIAGMGNMTTNNRRHLGRYVN